MPPTCGHKSFRFRLIVVRVGNRKLFENSTIARSQQPEVVRQFRQQNISEVVFDVLVVATSHAFPESELVFIEIWGARQSIRVLNAFTVVPACFQENSLQQEIEAQFFF